MRTSRPVSTSHTFSVLSEEPETMWRPSGVNATANTLLSCPERVRTSRSVPTSQTFSV